MVKLIVSAHVPTGDPLADTVNEPSAALATTSVNSVSDGKVLAPAFRWPPHGPSEVKNSD